MKHLFGPVPSRRLGRSLGIDLVPFKTCSLDCLYCECGPTTHLTVETRETIPYQVIKRELDSFLNASDLPDTFTFSGSGEPLLNSCIGDLVRYLKQTIPEVPVAVLTNGTLLSDSHIRRSILQSDLILPSLDAATPGVFKRINRPEKSLEIASIIAGLVEFRREFSGQIWLEVFIIPGINNRQAELLALKKAILAIHPDKVQLNTLDRPASDPTIRAATLQELEGIRQFWQLDPVEIITQAKIPARSSQTQTELKERVLSTIRRRPCTVLDLTEITGDHINTINKVLRNLNKEGQITTLRGDRGTFYQIKHGD